MLMICIHRYYTTFYTLYKHTLMSYIIIWQVLDLDIYNYYNRQYQTSLVVIKHALLINMVK